MTTNIEQLKKEFRYDPDTGEIFRRVGHASGHGYIRICVSRGKFIQAHRLAWVLAYGEFPICHIDHINGNKSDNKISNLRDVSNMVNKQNERVPRKNNKSGFLGVSWSKTMKRWTSRIHFDGKHHFLGYFDTPQQAHAAYLIAKRKQHEGCTI